MIICFSKQSFGVSFLSSVLKKIGGQTYIEMKPGQKRESVKKYGFHFCNEFVL